MQINVAQLLKAPIGTVRDYEVDEEVDIAGGGRPVRGKLKLIRTNRGILAAAGLHTGVEVNCSRCLGAFRCPLDFAFEEEYLPTTEVSSGVALSLPDGPGCFTIDKYHTLDLTEAIRQYALLAMPMKLLCREDCAGLCPVCGHNLNLGPCACPPQPEDSRWSALKKLTGERND